jgi:hypothetical protein
MKRVIIILVLVYTTSAFSQIVSTLPGVPSKLIKLDSLIFNELNLYRVSIGKPRINVFDTTDLRRVSYRLTELNTNSSNVEFDHTRDPRFKFKGYNSECIFMLEKYSTSNPLTNAELTEAELNFLAKETVQSWINSPNHNYIISADYIKRAAITSTVTIKDNRIRLIVSYHDISGLDK